MSTPAKYIAGLFLAGGIFLAGYMANRQTNPLPASALVKLETRYSCPMHPQYVSDRPGSCPICGMSLELSEESKPSAAGIVHISLAKQQRMGLLTENVEITASTQTIRLLGRVAADENRIFKLRAAVDGIVQEVFSGNTTGSMVKKGQSLATYYSPDIYAAVQGYLIAASSDRFRSNLQVQVTESRLQFLGMNKLQIDELKKSGEIKESITLCAPAKGFVVSRDISPDYRFQKGEELYRIAALDRVWILADVYEGQARYLHPGVTARVTHSQLGKELHARVSDVLPLFDNETRTLKVRLEVDNPGDILRPDMFADVALQVEMPPAITIPADSVIDLGLRKTVYVETADGAFVPRLIQTGWRLGDRVQVSEGLTPGERIVVSSNFLVDSESRMKLTGNGNPSASEKAETAKDPVCGMEMDPRSASTLKTQYRGKTYYFCGEQCKKKFQSNPEKYVPKPAAMQADKVKDLVCSMEIDPNAAGTLKTQYKGKTYYFCSKMCKKSFEADPAAYVRGGMATPGMHADGMTE